MSHYMVSSYTDRPPTSASGSNRKRPSSVAESDYESDSENDQSTNHDNKRPRTGNYELGYAQVSPLFSRKRRASSQDPDEKQAGYVDEYYIGQRQGTEQIIVQQSDKRARVDASSSAASSDQDENVNVDQMSGDQETEEDFESDNEDSENEESDIKELNAPEIQESYNEKPDALGFEQEDELPEEDDDDGAESEEEDQLQEEESEDDLRYIPANPPKLAFFIQPPVKDLSWNKGQWAPTFPYANQPEFCPIDFDYIRERANWLTDDEIHVYLIRKPWVPVGTEIDYDQVKDMLDTADATSAISLEEVRSRFGKANLAVFKTTGVWFEGSTHGLKGYKCEARTAAELQEDGEDDDDDDDDDVNVPEPLQAKERLRRGDDLVTFVLQPPRTGCEDRCAECCQSGLCYDEECCKAWQRFHDGADSDSDSESEVGDAEDEYEPYHVGDHSKERWGEVLSQQRTPFGCRTHQPANMHFVHYERFAAVRASRSPVNPVYVVDVSQRAFGLFASCFAPEFTGEFPKTPKQLCVYFDQQDTDNGGNFSEAVYEEIGKYTVGDVIEAYCCSQALDCPVVSDVLLGHLRNILVEGESLKLFEPGYIKYVFHFTNASDPIRLLLLDAFRMRMAHAKIIMRQHRHQYPPELVHYWDHWNRQQQDETSPENPNKIDDHTTQTYKGRRGVMNGLRGIICKVTKSDERPDDQEGDIWDQYVFKGWSSHTWKKSTGQLSREDLHQRLTQSDSVDVLSSGNSKTFWETYRNRPEDVD
jgi:hypothetical protein